MRFVVAMTGASGAVYGRRLLETLPGEKILVMSEVAKSIIPTELECRPEELEGLQIGRASCRERV